MAVQPSGLLTYEDFLAFPDDGVRREIVGGEAFATPAPNIRHQELVGFMYRIFCDHLDVYGGGRALLSPVDVRLSDHDVVEPDLVLVAENRLEIIQAKYILGSPTLLVEVVSDPRMDRVRKRALYARAAVPEYWIVDPDADRVEVYLLRGERYGKPTILEPGDHLTTVFLPGLVIDVESLFAR